MRIDINNQIYLERFDFSLTQKFFDAIHRIRNPDDIYRCRLQKKYPTLELLETRMTDAIENKFKDDGTPDFFIFEKSVLVGVFEFAPLEPNVDYIEIGYWLFAENRRRGILSNIMGPMMTYAKENFDRPRLIATTPVDNMASRALLEKCGFTCTGRIQEFSKDHGEREQDIEYEYNL